MAEPRVPALELLAEASVEHFRAHLLFRGDRHSVRAFPTRAYSMLEGERPIATVRSGSAGCTAVLDVIRRAEAGVVV